MFYKYPEEFIVPIIYTKDLQFDSNNANRSSCLIEDVIEKGERDLIDVDYITLKEFLDEGCILENTPSNNLDNENVRDIIMEIDNEYVNSEVGII